MFAAALTGSLAGAAATRRRVRRRNPPAKKNDAFGGVTETSALSWTGASLLCSGSKRTDLKAQKCLTSFETYKKKNKNPCLISSHESLGFRKRKGEGGGWNLTAHVSLDWTPLIGDRLQQARKEASRSARLGSPLSLLALRWGEQMKQRFITPFGKAFLPRPSVSPNAFAATLNFHRGDWTKKGRSDETPHTILHYFLPGITSPCDSESIYKYKKG